MTEQERMHERWRTMALVLAEILEGPRRCGTASSDIDVTPFDRIDGMLTRHAVEIRRELKEILP